MNVSPFNFRTANYVIIATIVLGFVYAMILDSQLSHIFIPDAVKEQLTEMWKSLGVMRSVSAALFSGVTIIAYISGSMCGLRGKRSSNVVLLIVAAICDIIASMLSGVYYPITTIEVILDALKWMSLGVIFGGGKGQTQKDNIAFI